MRLWPLSTQQYPKQFHALVPDRRTLFQETALRSQICSGATDPLILCNASQVDFVRSQLSELRMSPARIVAEPEARNTAPAIAAAALAAIDMASGEGDDPLLLVLPADHQIDDWADWSAAVEKASQAAVLGRLVTLGIIPTRPETGYGYIQAGEAHGDWFEVDRFVEKPDREFARSFIASGNFFWNSGMFVFSALHLIAELEKLEPDVMACVRRAMVTSESTENVQTLGAAFLESRSISIDYAVMEKTNAAAVVTLDSGWSDVGSWDAIYELLDKDEYGNAIAGPVIAIDSRNCLVRSESRIVGLVGVENLVIVETSAGILVMSRESGQEIRRIVEELAKSSDA